MLSLASTNVISRKGFLKIIFYKIVVHLCEIIESRYEKKVSIKITIVIRTLNSLLQRFAAIPLVIGRTQTPMRALLFPGKFDEHDNRYLSIRLVDRRYEYACSQ